MALPVAVRGTDNNRTTLDRSILSVGVFRVRGMDVGGCPTSSAISRIRGALDALAGVDRGGLSAEARLGLVESARREHDRLGALVGVLLAEADAVGASLVARGTPTTSWLGCRGPRRPKKPPRSCSPRVT